ncbi:MAG: CDP-alcohol phosphatidyltransferase family protein [Myxococcota bacterium]
MSEQSQKRPLITANMVTLARLIPMPILCWLVYQGQIWPALAVGVVIGCTDFVDGFLARKHGPTVLGGLLDPMADKVFIAFAYFPFADPELGYVSAWAVALMFVREFLVTALRSAYEQRGLTLKTSYFGKVKTWTQMQGIGLILLFILLGDEPAIMNGIIIAHIAAPLVAFAALWLIKRKVWLGAVLMSAIGVPFYFLYNYGDIGLVVEVAMIVIVATTWLSGIDYILVGMRQLRGRGDFGRADIVRLLGSVAIPLLIFAALAETSMNIWFLVTILAVEVSVGGLDNLLSHHRAAAGALAWGLRVVSISLLLGVALALPEDSSVIIDALGGAAALISIVGVGIEFWRGRKYYMVRHLRERAMANAEQAE